MMKSLVRSRRVLMVCLLSTLILTACEDKRRHKLSNAASFSDSDAPAINNASCDDVVKAMLRALVDAQRARADGFGKLDNRQKYDKAMATIWSLMASDKIYESVKRNSPTVPKSVSKDVAMTLVAESWVSIVAHYVDGVQWQTLNVASSTKRATASIQLENPEERKMQEEIESSPQVMQVKDASGKPILKESEEYWDLVREMAIRKGFNVPVGAVLTLTLQNVNDAWRVESLNINAAPLRVVPKSSGPSTTQPALSH